MNRRDDIFDAWNWRVARDGSPRHDCLVEACRERLRYACWLARPNHPIGKRRRGYLRIELHLHEESVKLAGFITGAELVTKMVLSYFHERAWSAIRWDQRGQIGGQSNST
jgi:hypothetical protein